MLNAFVDPGGFISATLDAHLIALIAQGSISYKMVPLFMKLLQLWKAHLAVAHCWELSWPVGVSKNVPLSWSSFPFPEHRLSSFASFLSPLAILLALHVHCTLFSPHNSFALYK